MIENNALMYQADCDRCWTEMRQQLSQLEKIIKGKEEFEPIDFILIFQCLTLIIAEIALHEKHFLSINEKTKKFFSDDSLYGYLKRTIEEVKYWKIITNEELSLEKRLETIEILRKSIWGVISCQKNKLIDLMQYFPNINDSKDFGLLIHCVSVAILELDLKEKEIKLLGIDNFLEN